MLAWHDSAAKMHFDLYLEFWLTRFVARAII